MNAEGTNRTLEEFVAVMYTIYRTRADRCYLRNALHYLFFVCLYEKRFLVLCGVSSSRRRLVKESHLRREFTQLVSHHVFRYGHVMVYDAIVNLEAKTHEVGQDSRCSCLRLYRRSSLARLRSYDR